MKKLFGIIILLICLSSINFCYNVNKNPEINSYELENLSDKQIINQIKINKLKIEAYKEKIQLLKNYNQKFRFKLNFDRSFNLDVTAIQSTMAKNEDIIFKYRISIRKLEVEIRVLKRRLNKDET